MNVEIYRFVGKQTQDVPPTASSFNEERVLKFKWSSSVPFTKNMDAGTGTPPLNYASTSALVVLIQGKEPLVTPRTSRKKCPYAHISLRVQEPLAENEAPTHSPSSSRPQTHKRGNSPR